MFHDVCCGSGFRDYFHVAVQDDRKEFIMSAVRKKTPFQRINLSCVLLRLWDVRDNILHVQYVYITDELHKKSQEIGNVLKHMVLKEQV